MTLLLCSTLLCISNLFLHFCFCFCKWFVWTWYNYIYDWHSGIYLNILGGGGVQNHGSEYSETCLNRTPWDSSFVFGINRFWYILVKLTIISYIWTWLNVRFIQDSCLLESRYKQASLYKNKNIWRLRNNSFHHIFHD